MKALIKDLRGILVSNAIVSAILNRKKKVKEPVHYESHDNSDLLELIAKAKKVTEALPEPEKPVQLTLQEIKEIMDEHAKAPKNSLTFADQEATIRVDAVDVVKIRSQNKGNYPAYVGKEMADMIYDGIPQGEVSSEFAKQVLENEESFRQQLRSEIYRAASLDPKHERDTQAIGMGDVRKTGTMTDPQFHPNRTFNFPMEYENREMRRQREREEKRNKKRGKK